MTELAGKVAIVTGSGGGIGRAEALRLAADGAALVVNDFNVAAAEETAGLIRDSGGRAAVAGGDVGNFAVAQSLVETAIGAFGRLDILVNNAGNSRPKFVVNMTEEDWDSVLNVHLKGTFLCTKFAAMHWQAQFKLTGQPVRAAIINTTSINGLHGQPGYANYVAAKGGIASLTLMLAKELATFGVRVNAIAPLAFSAMTTPMWGGELFTDARREELSPDNVAMVVGWLAGPRSEPLTGEIVDFGLGRLTSFEEWPVKGSAVSDDGLWDYDKLDFARVNLFPA